MIRFLFLSCFVLSFCVGGCQMLTAWRSIPPPGGCDQCHTVAISNNWRVAYQAPNLSDERNTLAFQTPGYNMPPPADSTMSSLEVRKVQDLKCFECHRAPSEVHKDRAGRYHH